ncbi:MAG: hypothetical protein U0324_00390 [Polyangiales bacterium]
MNSRATNCGPLSLMIRGRASGCFSRARCNTSSTSSSFIVSRISKCRIARDAPSSTEHR